MYNKEELKKYRQVIKALANSSTNWEDLDGKAQSYFKKLNDLQSADIEENNEKYNIIEIANCKYKTDRVYKLNKDERVVADYYFYDKAPNGILIILNNFVKFKKGWGQNKISLLIEK